MTSTISGLGGGPFAICDRHKLKSWVAIVAAGKHNHRSDSKSAHLIPGAPKPEFIHGSPNLHADVKAKFQELGLVKRIQGGVMAVELVLQPSADWDGLRDPAKVRDWVDASVEHLRDKWGSRVATQVRDAVAAAVTAARSEVEAEARVVAVQVAEERRLEDQTRALLLANEDAARAEALRLEDERLVAEDAKLSLAIEGSLQDRLAALAERERRASEVEAMAATYADFAGKIEARCIGLDDLFPGAKFKRQSFRYEVGALILSIEAMPDEFQRQATQSYDREYAEIVEYARGLGMERTMGD